MPKKNIMVMDDDEINILVETSYIKKYGFIDVIVARNGQEAIINIKDTTSKGKFFDIIFTDCRMPVMDDYQALIEIKEMMGSGLIKNLIIVAVIAKCSRFR